MMRGRTALQHITTMYGRGLGPLEKQTLSLTSFSTVQTVFLTLDSEIKFRDLCKNSEFKVRPAVAPSPLKTKKMTMNTFTV